jgi:hypothetical protein
MLALRATGGATALASEPPPPRPVFLVGNETSVLAALQDLLETLCVIYRHSALPAVARA